MKYFLTAFAFWSVSAAATPQECSSIWIFNAWKSCAHASHGVNTAVAGTSVGSVDKWSEWYGGKKPSQEVICQRVAAAYNREIAASGRTAVLAQATPIDEEKKENRGVYVEYKYQCKLNVTQFPMVTKASRACGADEKLSYKIGGLKTDIQGDSYCLSCDEYTRPETKVICLQTMITEIVNVDPKPVDLRDSDIQAVAKSVREIMEMAKITNIRGLSDNVQTFTLFNTFLQKNPAP